MRGSSGGMEEEDDGITRTARELPTGINEEDEEGIKLKLYFFLKK